MKQFSIQLGILVGILSTLIFCWNLLMPVNFQLQSLWIILAFLALVTYFMRYLLFSGNKTPQQFIRHFMGSTFVKMFIYLIVMGTYAFTNRPEAVKFILSFLVLYFVFTIFDVVSLTKHLKK